MRKLEDILIDIESSYRNEPIPVYLEGLQEELQSIDSHKVLKKGIYDIDFQIVVEEKGVLEIKPGAKLFFRENAGILSYGKLIAKGTKGKEIIFTATKDKWKNITIAGSYTDGSILEYCEISRGSGRRIIPSTDHFNLTKHISNYGGGLGIYKANPTLKNNTIQRNSAKGGGGGIYIHKSTLALINCIVKNNTAGGGGIHTLEGDVTLYNNTIQNNIVKHCGGGLNSFSTNLRLENNRIGSNYAKEGGGLYLNHSTGLLIKNKILDNKAREGGGLKLCHSDVVLEDNILQGNISRSGAGLYVWHSSPLLHKDKIIHNIAENQGGGLWIYLISDVQLRNNTIKNNIPDDIYDQAKHKS